MERRGRWTRLIAVLALLAVPVGGTPPRAAEPIDRVARRWLAAFNSGDGERLKAFHASQLGEPDPRFLRELAHDSCGLRIHRFVARSPTAATVLLRQRCLPGLVRLTLQRTSATASGLKRLEAVPLPLPGDGAVAATAAIAERLAAEGAFAGSLVVRRGGRMLLARSWGSVRPPAPTPITLDTPMFLASAGKMFTAVAVLQLVEAGRVELDAPIGRYLPDYPDRRMAGVTIRQLLTHRGGAGDIGILAREDGFNRASVRTINDIVRLNGGRPPAFEPGTRAEYSNYGFVLLGAVIERVTGARYQDHVAAAVFGPAGMTASGFPDRDHLDGVVVGYTTFFGAEPKPIANLGVLPWRGTSAGGGVASARDMLRFLDALRDGRLLSPAMTRLATSAGATPWYGLGFVVNPAAGRASWGHGGNSYGMDVATHVYPERDTTFVCLGARDGICNRLIFAWYLRTFGPGS